MAKLIKSKLNLIYGLGALIGFSQALLVYVESSFFRQQSGQEGVGIYYFAAYLLALVLLVNLHKLVRVWGKANILKLAIAGEIAMMAVILTSGNPWHAILALVFYMVFDSLMSVSMDVVLESHSRDAASGRIRGVYLTIWNLGFLAGPKLSSWLLLRYDFDAIFLTVLALKSLILLGVAAGLGVVAGNHLKERLTVGALLAKVWRRKSIMKIYYISFALEFFYALMIIYSPLYLRDLGLSWDQIGLILVLMLLPFTLLEYPLGWLADKRWGEKEMLVFFLLWQALSTAALYSISGPTAWLWALGLFTTRIGAAAVQILRDSYFYKRIDGDDIDLIDFFRTAAPLAYMVAAAGSVLLLNWFGLKEMFLVNALVVLSALPAALWLKDNLSEAEQRQAAAIRPLGEAKAKI